MRLGAPVTPVSADPKAWADAVRASGHRAAYCPVPIGTPSDTVLAYADAARQADIVIAEVGAWSNPLSANADERRNSIEKCIASLALADEIGARCCVNIAGSLGSGWAGPDARDLTGDAFDQVVATVRMIIDAARPTRTAYTLEPMPWMWPDSPESYLDLIRAIDRCAFGVHLDIANMINCPSRYFANTQFTHNCFDLLGPLIRSCHVKDVAIRDGMPINLAEVRPGLGGLDLATILRRGHAIDADMPIMLEHLPNAEEYRLAADHVRVVATQIGISL